MFSASVTSNPDVLVPGLARSFPHREGPRTQEATEGFYNRLIANDIVPMGPELFYLSGIEEIGGRHERLVEVLRHRGVVRDLQTRAILGNGGWQPVLPEHHYEKRTERDHPKALKHDKLEP